MKLTKDNAFVGARVTHRTEGENLYVYKVNDKSFYAGPKTPEEVEEYNKPSLDSKAKIYSTFSKLMKVVGGKQYQYKDFDIDENEAERKEKKEKIDKLKKEQKKYLSPSAEKLVKKLYKISQSGKGSWGHSNFVNKTHIVLISVNNEGKCVVRSGSDVIFYHVETGIQRLFDYEKDKSGKKVLWENFEIF